MSQTPNPRVHLHSFLRRLIVGVALAAFFAWLALRPQPGSDDAGDDRLVQREFLAMGTLVSVSIWRDGEQSVEQAEQAASAVERMLLDYERRWSAWGDGELGALNRALAAGDTVTIPEPLRALFGRAAQLHVQSQGRFDVRIGRLVQLWGFDDELHYRSAPPDAQAVESGVAALAKAPPLDEHMTQYGPAPQIAFDFGAIAKGDAIDLAIDQLRQLGFGNAIVNAGGNLRASGRRGERAWRIGIRHPRPDEQHRLLATLEISGDEAVITSGDYERYFEHEGRRYHHLLDPHTGYPAQGLQSVTVVTNNGALADAASTALFVAGAQHWYEQARALGVSQVMVVDADGQVHATPGLAERLRFADGVHLESPHDEPR